MRMEVPPLYQLSGIFCAWIVKTWHFSCGLSPVEAALCLNEISARNNFVRCIKPVSGSALPALVLLLRDGWTSGNNEEWSGLSAMYVKLRKTKVLVILMRTVPAIISANQAAVWFCAALEENERCRFVKRLAQ